MPFALRRRARAAVCAPAHPWIERDIMSVAQITPAGSASPSMPLEFLAFTLGAEEYGVDIQKVQELRGYDNVTRIANAPAYIKGVVNLRGIIVPIVDMRMKLSIGVPTYDQFTVVVILSIKGTVMGMVVDSVSDVTTLLPEQIKPAPQISQNSEADYVTGLGSLDERLLILVDIERLMGSHDVASFALAA
jgi:purine-binding chemotaxis protein CheW